MKIPLVDIEIKCANCHETAFLDEVLEDAVRFYKQNGNAIRPPREGMTTGQIEAMEEMNLICEMCQEESESNA